MFTQNNKIQNPAKRQLLSGCAILGMIAIWPNMAAQAQLLANPINDNPAIFEVSTSGTTTFVNINGPSGEAYIQWNPTAPSVGGVIDVLPSGSSLNFSGSGNYTVLNHFVTASGGALNDMIALNGAVTSNFDSSSGSIGGNIWFQNAGGILVGNGGTFNVGSLLLTSREIDLDGGLYGEGNSIRLGGAGTSGAIIHRGLINASPADGASYVALVAPSISQEGIISANGSIAYVAAEAVDIRVEAGLFDIAMRVGADGGTVINHSGTSDNLSNSANHNIYFAALPKNDAITMLVGGNLGHSAAAAGVGRDGNIILSAGYDVAGGTIMETPISSGPLANINLASAAILGDLEAAATGIVSSNLSAEQSLAISGQARLSGQTGVDIQIATGGALSATYLELNSAGRGASSGHASLSNAGGTIVIDGDLTINASRFLSDGLAAHIGGTAELLISGGTTNLLGGVYLYADAGGFSDRGGEQIHATGGTARLNHSGGELRAQNMVLSANGFGSEGSAGVAGGNGQGGNIFVNFGPNDAASSFIGGLQASANGEGGSGGESSDGPSGGNGGFGRGGTIEVHYASAATNAPEFFEISAMGFGGMGGGYDSAGGVAGSGGAGGLGQGGTVHFQFSPTTDAQLNAAISVDGFGGQAGSSSLDGFAALPAVQQGPGGGAGLGGSIISAISGAYDDASLNFSADGSGGAGGSSFIGGAGGAATGGSISLTISDSDRFINDFSARATAQGGMGGEGLHGSGGAGGAAAGGSIGVIASGAATNIELGSEIIRSGAVGGSGGASSAILSGLPAPIGAIGGSGGAAVGGTIGFTAEQGATLALNGGSGDFYLRSEASGGYGGFHNEGGLGGAGGTASGGAVNLSGNGGTITTDQFLQIDVSNNRGEGANGAADGQSSGGRATLIASDVGGDAGALSLAPVRIVADGDIAGRIEISASAGGEISFADLEAQTLESALSPTNGDMLSSTSGILLQANGGTIIAESSMMLNSGGSIGFYAAGTGQISANELLSATASDQIILRHTGRAAGGISLLAGDADMQAGSNIIGDTDSHFSALGSFSAAANSGIDLGMISLDNDNSFSAGSGDLRIANLAGSAAINGSGENVIITSNGLLNVGDLQAYDGDVRLSSADINLSTSGQISASDNIILSNNDPSQTMYVGGFGSQSGYHLDADEMFGLMAPNIIIETQANSANPAPLMIVDEFQAMGNFFETHLRLQSAGDVRVIGTAVLRGDSPNNHFHVEAGGLLHVVMGEGALRVENFGTGDAPSGFLHLQAPRIIIASDAALADLNDISTVEAMEKRLAESDDYFARDGGLLADSINISITDEFLVQNSGDSADIADRRGISFGEGGLNFTTGAAPSLIIANGIRASNGEIITGADALAGITINGSAPSSSSGINPSSVMNSCLIINSALCGPDALTPPIMDYPIPPIKVIVEENVTKDEDEIEADDREASSIPDSLISLRDLDPISGEPLIDDPVTGAGNDDLWGPIVD